MYVYKFIRSVIYTLFFLTLPIGATAQCWEVAMEVPDEYVFGSIHFVNENTGWLSGTHLSVTGDTNYIAKTINGGETWDFTYYPDPFFADYELTECCTILHFVDENIGYGGFSSYALHKTIDGGNSWERLSALDDIVSISPSLASYYMYAIEFISPDTGWVSVIRASSQPGEPNNSGVYKTIDGGETWSYQVDWTMFDIEFINPLKGYAVSGGASTGSLWYTNDGGEHWLLGSMILTNPGYLTNIQFINDSVGWVAGKSRLIYKTTDGGATWQTIENPTGIDFDIEDMEFVNDSVGWISSNSHFIKEIQYTKDGGETWTVENIPTVGAFPGMSMINQYEGWAISRDGFLIHYDARPACSGLQGIVVTNPAHRNNAGYNPTAPLMPNIVWKPIYGCIDGYLLQFTMPSDTTFFMEIDVGLDTSYQVPTPFPDSTGVLVKIIPYNHAYGTEGVDIDCYGRRYFFTVPCPPLSPPIDTFICEGEDFYWDGHIFEEPGTYNISYLTEKDCDSTLTLNLQYAPYIQTIVDTILMAGETLNGVIYTHDTLFTAFLPAASGCDSIVVYVIDIATGVDSPEQNLFWTIFPNPAKDELFITSKYAWAQMILYDSQGRVLRQWNGDLQIEQKRLDVSHLATGLYFIQIKGEKGTGVRRVVIE